jgi:hypothetical protein
MTGRLLIKPITNPNPCVSRLNALHAHASKQLKLQNLHTRTYHFYALLYSYIQYYHTVNAKAHLKHTITSTPAKHKIAALQKEKEKEYEE